MQRLYDWVPLAVDVVSLCSYIAATLLIAISAASGHSLHSASLSPTGGTDDDVTSSRIVDSLLTSLIPVVVGEAVVLLHDAVAFLLAGAQVSNAAQLTASAPLYGVVNSSEVVCRGRVWVVAALCAPCSVLRAAWNLAERVPVRWLPLFTRR